MVTVTVTKDYAGKKLDNYLKDKYTTLPSSAIFKALRKKDIRINGVKTNENVTLNSGDEVTLYIKDDILFGINSDSSSSAKKNIQSSPLKIIYEDDNLILINKMPGISVHSDKKGSYDTLIDLVKDYLPPGSSPSLCHRLDHYTGGIVIIAKTPYALKLMLEKIKNREIKKYYKCIVKGRPSSISQEIKHFLFKDEEKSRVYIYNEPRKGALTAITRYNVVKTVDDLSLLNVELVTGRTHQIRAHLSYIGHPVLGDDKYGDRNLNKKYKARHQCLWAYKVVFDFKDAGPLEYLSGKTFETIDIRFPIKGNDFYEA